MYFIDGTFFKSHLYDGVLVQLCGKHGYGGSMRLAAAWFPVENTQNYAFFIIHEINGHEYRRNSIYV